MAQVVRLGRGLHANHLVAYYIADSAQAKSGQWRRKARRKSHTAQLLR